LVTSVERLRKQLFIGHSCIPTIFEVSQLDTIIFEVSQLDTIIPGNSQEHYYNLNKRLSAGYLSKVLFFQKSIAMV